MKSVHPVLAMLPGTAPENAFDTILEVERDGLFALDHSKCQITPQNPEWWTVEKAQAFASRYPDTAFRLHASVRLGGERVTTLPWYDMSRWVGNPRQAERYFQQVGDISRALGAEMYTLHTGFRPRRDDSIKCLLCAYNRIEDAVGHSIAIETLYPGERDPRQWWVSTWEEHRQMLDLGMNYVLDLSHLNIIAAHEGVDEGLVRELFASEQLKEVHLSCNDGVRDSHASLSELDPDTWWLPHIEAYRGNADIFTEGELHA